MRAYDERELLQNVCDTVVDVGGYVLCWVGFVEHDEPDGPLRCQRWKGR
jgi:hypothetical protein